jgi:hypothetical protein
MPKHLPLGDGVDQNDAAFLQVPEQETTRHGRDVSGPQTRTVSLTGQELLVVTVEPDIDRDGLGDESQDPDGGLGLGEEDW